MAIANLACLKRRITREEVIVADDIGRGDVFRRFRKRMKDSFIDRRKLAPIQNVGLKDRIDAPLFMQRNDGEIQLSVADQPVDIRRMLFKVRELDSDQQPRKLTPAQGRGGLPFFCKRSPVCVYIKNPAPSGRFHRFMIV